MNGSAVHSQTLPVMSESPYPLGGNVPTGDVPRWPRHGNSPTQRFARRGSSSSPHAKAAPSSPPRAAYSHSASVGSVAPAHAAYASASSGVTCVTGWRARE